jgi:ABC-type transport system involved in Fe-S cluster assembly fused permease/ATPase subunit
MKVVNFFRAVFPFFWGTDKKVKALIVLSIGFGLITVVLNLCVPISLRYILNLLSSSTHQSAVSAILIVASYGLIWTFAQITQTLRFVFLFQPINRASRTISLAFFQHMLSLPLGFHLDRKTGSLIGNIEQAQNSLPSLINAVMWQIAPLVLEVTSAIAIICWMYGAIYGFMIFATLFIYTMVTMISVNNAVKLQKFNIEKRKNASSYLHDSLLNYETIKYFNNDPVELSQYDALLKDKEYANTKVDTKMFMINMLQMVIVGIGITCITSYAGYSIFNRHLTVGDFVLLNGYVLQFSVPMSYFGYLIREMKKAYFDLQCTLDILKLKSDISENAYAPLLTLQSTDILFEEVKFAYDKQRDIIKGISFEVPHGKTVAIVGPTGSGKSTIAKLIYRFFDVSSGEILINNQNIKSVALDSLRRAIGIVPQEALLFNNTLKYNIAYGNKSASEDDIWQAIEMAGLISFIDKLPAGLETLVGERGLKISGGEKQRVAIARMLLKKPDIYIFDEATSSLDVEMEQQIQKNINTISKNITTIIIAHRLSTVKHADEIIVLHQSEILERGTHNSLLTQKGYYFEMYQRQVSHLPEILKVS